MFSLKACRIIQLWCVLAGLFIWTSAIADEEPLAFDSEVGSISEFIQQKNPSQAQVAIDKYWAKHSKDEQFVEAARRIKDVYWQEGDYAAHFALCDRIIEAFPNHPLAAATEADIVTGYISLKDTTKATEKLEQFWARYNTRPDFIEQLQNIKNVCWWSESYDMYFPLCRRVVDAFPSHPQAVVMLADQVNGYTLLGDSDKAAEKLEEFWARYSKHPDFIEQLQNTKKICWWNGKDSMYFAICDRFVQEFPEHPLSISMLADQVKGYVDRQNTEKASEKMEAFWTRYHTHPDFVQEVKNINDACWWHKNYSMYFSNCEKIVRQFPDHPLAIVMQADQLNGYVILQDSEKAAAKLDELWTRYSTHPEFTEQLENTKKICSWNNNDSIYAAVCDRFAQEFKGHPLEMRMETDGITGYIHRGQLPLAEEKLAQLLSECTDDDKLVEYLNDIARSYNEAGQFQKAEELYQYALDHASANNEDLVKTRIGKIASQIGRKQEAADIQLQIDTILSDYSGNPKLAEPVFLLGEQYYLRAGETLKKQDFENANADYMKAIKVWDKTISQTSDSYYRCLAYYFSANTYEHMGSYEEAIRYYQQVVNEWPEFDRAWSAQYMIAECYDQLFKTTKISKEEAELQVIKACHELEKRYPDSKASIAAKQLLASYESI